MHCNNTFKIELIWFKISILKVLFFYITQNRKTIGWKRYAVTCWSLKEMKRYTWGVSTNSLLLLIDGSGHNLSLFLFAEDTFFLLIFPIETCQVFLKVIPLFTPFYERIFKIWVQCLKMLSGGVCFSLGFSVKKYRIILFSLEKLSNVLLTMD